ncbi:MAG: AzlC family ABC transporter permease [Spirochaetales bacterium]|nr:AzlC family ABC transporter permease [Spirochaetales bacterium]
MKNDFIYGIKRGWPIFIGYFSASITFGLLCRNGGLPFFWAVAFSVSNFAGASQFMALNLFLGAVHPLEIIIAVFLINLRYFLMSASLFPKLRFDRKWHFPLCAFSNTDENFTTAYFSGKTVSSSFMLGLGAVSWSGWVSGTITGYLAGMHLPASVQNAAGIALYALFAALLVPEIKKARSAILIAAGAALLNSVLGMVLGMSAGWAFAASMLVVAGIAAMLLPPEEQTEEEVTNA